ncbi:GntR family transcriptional regulator [Mangrovibacter phragmitis]|uniref:GntR family transcriptional regulator n=1 Tax=Mangrovibacter phragmitis TaxID=1691903 RepID=A0A1B7L7E9_9ENTR|nr:PLP-dependent aminotransferase family protein [Mangrovibacter phragmitis]OAT78319.1 GntR family transcriptional regulator [Mangrovibacter phragmitis]
MKKYQQLAERIAHQIELGVWHPGDRLPSIREQTGHSGVSFMTVTHAYQLLESRGLIIARPQSGYYVSPPESATPPGVPASLVHQENVDINSYIFDVLQASSRPGVVPFGSAFPDPKLFPLAQLNRSLAHVARNTSAVSMTENLPPGHRALRQAIARRYAQHGLTISPDEIVITTGALEALNLSLQAVTEPGDWVVVETPCFYGALQAIERLKLKMIAIPSSPHHGIDLAALEQALNNWPVKACWLMGNHQNPLGFTLADERKQQIVDLLTQHQVTLVEDDVYGELYQGNTRPAPFRAFDTGGITLHCASFSKSLVAGFRVGWVAAGRHARRIQQLQLMSTLSGSAPVQMALADYLTTRSYDTHLRRLRRVLAERKHKAWQILRQHLPENCVITRHDGGYFLWISLPEGIDTRALNTAAIREQISVAPVSMFTVGQTGLNGFRVNTSFPWQEREILAVQTLGRLLQQALNAAS